ncbi:unnamed protein product, partial [Heligmosomoides polygyrus]
LGTQLAARSVEGPPIPWIYDRTTEVDAECDGGIVSSLAYSARHPSPPGASPDSDRCARFLLADFGSDAIDGACRDGLGKAGRQRWRFSRLESSSCRAMRLQYANLLTDIQYCISFTIILSATSRSGSTASSASAAAGFILNEEPITLFRLELERLQYILHFPEEVAFQDEYMIALFQLSSTEYELFYSIQPMDYVRYVSCDLTSVPISENPSPVRNLVKRLSEVSSWITHVIVSQPTHDDRKIALTAILRIIETCWNIG